jgi:NTP pyrophosphatase (non-canonical NTP hydrolase)
MIKTLVNLENEYRNFVAGLCVDTSPRFKMAEKDFVSPGFLHGAMGMVTEAAEILDLCKKGIGYQREPDMLKVNEEMGDALFYWTLVAIESGLDIRKLFNTNMAKLRARYPTGELTTELANNRDLKKEHEALNKENEDERLY